MQLEERKIMNLIYGTKNPAKVAAMKRRLATIHIPIQGLFELGQVSIHDSTLIR